jgi:diaminopimelate decarboxylase
MTPHFTYRDGRLCCEGVPLAEIARAVGTPAWVYSRARIEENYRAVAHAFAPLRAHIHYALKANANLAILRLLAGLGAGADVVSGGEVFRALRAGFPAERIVFAGVGKTRAELIYALRSGVGWFNVESEQELALLDQLAKEFGKGTARVALRLNPDVLADTHEHIATGHAAAKFGVDLPTAERLAREWGRFPHLRLEGVHVHIGSQLFTPAATVKAVQRALHFIEEAKTAGHSVRALNIGGGFPIAYDDSEAPATVQDFSQALTPLLHDAGLSLLTEPGRRLVADAGALLVEVQYVKESYGVRFAVADGGMNDLLRPALYGARHRVWPVAQSDGPTMPAQVAGPVCESADFLARDVPLPSLAPEDLLAVLDGGAYGAVMSSTYNARPLAPEVLVEGETFRVVRRRQTWDDLIALEETPLT